MSDPNSVPQPQDAVRLAHKGRLAIRLVRSLATLRPIVAGVVEPHLGVTKKATIVESPSPLGRLSAAAASKRGSAADKPRAVFLTHAAPRPRRDAMRIPGTFAVRHAVAFGWAVTSVAVARLGDEWLAGTSRIGAYAMTRFLAALAIHAGLFNEYLYQSIAGRVQIRRRLDRVSQFRWYPVP